MKFLGDDILSIEGTKSMESNLDVIYSRRERRGNSRLDDWPQVMITAQPPLFALLLC